jgi:hypothetical protein
MLDNSYPKERALDFGLFEIYQNFKQLVFCRSEDGSITDSRKERINKQNVHLLFIWPLIVAKRLLFPYLELELYKEQCNLVHNLKNETSHTRIQELLSIILTIEDFSKTNKKSDILSLNKIQNDLEIVSLSDFFRKTYSTIKNDNSFKQYFSNNDESSLGNLIDNLLGGKPNSKNISSTLSSKVLKKTILNSILNKIVGSEKIEIKIRNCILYYYIVLLIILKYNHDDHHLGFTLEDIVLIIEDYLNNNNDDINEILKIQTFETIFTFGSYLFSDTIDFFLDGYKKIFLKNGYPKKLDLVRHRFFEEDPYYFASFYQIDDQEAEDFGNYIIDVERQLKIFEEYKLEFWFQKNMSTKEFLNLVLLKCGEKSTDNLINCLSALAYELSILIYDYSNKYNDFISNADVSIDNNLEQFLESIDTIHNSYHLFSEYTEQKDFCRAIENLDMDLGYKCIEETRKVLKKKKKSHLSPKLIQDLLVANNEISLLFSSVQRKNDAHKTRIAKEFFRENPHFFKILNFDDIKDVEFSSDPNVIRNTRRKIFYNIAEKAGKEIAGYKIAKELAVE